MEMHNVSMQRSDLVQKEVFDSVMSDSCHKDILVACSDGSVRAHRVVLATASRFLRGLLENPATDTILLPDFPQIVVQHWMHLLYVGELEVNSPEMVQLWTLLSLLGVDNNKAYKSFQEGGKEEEERENNAEEEEEEEEEEGNMAVSQEDQENAPEDVSISPDVVDLVECNLDPADINSTPSVTMYPCRACSNEFTDPEQLELHVKRTHAGPGEYRCSQCTVTFYDRLSLTMHRREHKRGDRLISCPICKKTSTEASIRRHLSLHGVAAIRHFVPYTCKICGKAFPKSQILASHVKREHRLTSVKIGDPKVKPRIQLLMQAKKAGAGEREWTATIPTGSALSTDQESSVSGSSSHTSMLESQLNCLMCPMKFQTETERRNHKASHGPDPTYVCNLCSKPFQSELLYHKHATLHKGHGEDTTNCLVCGRRYQTRRGFLHHVPSHHGDEVEPRRRQSLLTCRICAQRFTSQKSLQAHNLQHPFHFPFQCNMCKYAYPSSQQLVSHDCPKGRSKPSPQPSSAPLSTVVAASSDPKAAASSLDSVLLKKRRMQQQGMTKGLSLAPIPPHYCLICHEAFDGEEEYQVHRRTHPPGSLHRCDVCLRGFKTPSQCLEHRVFHSNVKKYHCPSCPKSFHVYRFLGYHMRDHHGM